MSKEKNKSRPIFLTDLETKITAFQKIIESNKDNTEPALSPFENNIYHTRFKLFTYKEIEKFDEIINYAISHSELGKSYSREYITQQIIDIFHKILSGTIDIHTELDNFFSILTKNFNDEWLIVSEIENIRLLKSTEFKLVDCTIKFIMDPNFPVDKKKLGGIKDFDYLHKPCIYTTVKAGDAEKANMLAIENFTLSFSLLKLYAPSFKPVLKGTLLAGDRKLTSYNITKELIHNSSSTTGDLPLNHAYLDDDFYSHLKQKGIAELSTNSSITIVVKQCLYWYKMGLEEELPSAKLLNFVTILESSLKKKAEKDELKQRVADRCALLLENKFEERKKIVDDISDIYKIRSKVVHTGVIIDDKNLAELAGGYARAVLIELIKRNSGYGGEFEKFIDDIDDKKYYGEKSAPKELETKIPST